jgi:hypothetical protein
MPVNCLAYLISPTHLISATCAIKSLHQNEDVNIVLIVHWPGLSDERNEELANIIIDISKEFHFIKKIIPISQLKLSDLLIQSRSPSAGIQSFKDIIVNKIEFNEIYYSHNVVGEMYQFLCTAFPSAQRICFGDALGNVYEKEVHLSFLIKTPVALTPKEFKPHKAALILPVDQSGNFLKNIPLTVCDKNIVIDMIERCISSASDLQNYIQNILLLYRNSKKYLLLTENIAEGNFIDFNREIDMWCSIIEDNCIPGSVIFLKSHPGETLQRNNKIAEKLSDRYEVVELDKKFKRYPIEIWKNLVLNYGIICMSYPVLSLKYLYDIDVMNPMNDAFIERWFPAWTWDSFKNAHTLYMEPLKNLAHWDGKSVLYSGNLKR